MKRVISILLSAALSISALPAAFAADNAVTAADVERAMANNSLANNAEDLAVYKDSYAEKLQGEYLDPARTYLMYSVIEYGDMDYEINYYAAKPEAADIKSGLESREEISDGGSLSRYIFLNIQNSNEMGSLYCYYFPESNPIRYSAHGSRSRMSPGVYMLFFDSETLAGVINESGIGAVSNIFMVFPTEDIFGHSVIYIETAAGEEYVITNVVYRNGRLYSYDILDSLAFIEAMRGDYAASRESGYNRLAVKQPARFSDVPDDSAVELLVRLGIADGYDDGTFGADKLITRAEASKLLSYLSVPKDYNIEQVRGYWYDNALTDVAPEHWAFNYIQYGFLRGYINGKEKTGTKLSEVKIPRAYVREGEDYTVFYGEDRYIDTYNFCPEDPVTEQELAKMIVCVIERFSEEMSAAEGGWPDGYVSVAKRIGVCENASDKPATRLTAAHMIKNALDATVNFEHSRIDLWNWEEQLEHEEWIFERNVFFNTEMVERRVRLTGKITEELRDNEYKFVIDADVNSHIGEFKAGEEQAILAGYADVKDFIGMDCTIYCEQHYGNLVAIMAE